MLSGLKDYGLLIFCVDLGGSELFIQKAAVQIRSGDLDVRTNTVLKHRIAESVLAVCHGHLKSGSTGLKERISKVTATPYSK